VSNGAQAQHERNVLLRNDGHGAFDEVSGPSGLGIDQDGRAFAVFDFDGDGDSDIVLMAPRASPQVRLFRNDFASDNAAVALRLKGTKSNRDTIGAKVTIDTDNGSITRVVNAGSGFLSQHSKELVIGLGKRTRITKTTILWPSGAVQNVANLPLNQRTWIEEGVDQVRSEPFNKASVGPMQTAVTPPRTAVAPDFNRVNSTAASELSQEGTWLYQPFPAPDFTLRGLDGRDYSLSGLAGKPVIVCFWASWAPPSLAAVQDLSKQRDALSATGASLLAVAVDPVADEAKVKAASLGLAIPVMLAGEEVAGTYNVLHRYLFDRREDLGLPTAFLIDAHGDIVKVYKVPISISRILQDVAKIDVPPPDRLTRAVPFPGAFLGSLGTRNDFQYGLELSEQGYDSPALVAFERVAKTDPSAITFYNLGTLYMKRGKTADARTAFERALQLKADYADADNSLGALMAQNGDVPGAIERFRAALAARPQFADAMNNLGFALFQTGDAAQARELYEKALALQPDFPEALNNLGIFYGTQRDLDRALGYFQQAVNQRATYGEAANNLALVLNARGETDQAIAVLQRLLQANPSFEMGYVTVCRIYLKAGNRQEATKALEQLLQRNPTHPIGLQLLQQIRAGG
jgi:Tfp pilus assembly protein PilF/peroxiredoxin